MIKIHANLSGEITMKQKAEEVGLYYGINACHTIYLEAVSCIFCE